MDDRNDTIVIGGGQAGLAAAHHLTAAGAPFVVLDSEAATGDQWMRRWESLTLFTPARHSGLPGMPWDGPPGRFPTRGETREYLARYSAQLAAPIRHGVTVTGVARDADGFAVATTDGTMHASRVIVATGATSTPHVPPLAADLDPRIVSMHSHDYRSPVSVAGTRVLVVGFGNSGAEIALELARDGRTVTIAGTPTPHPPDALLAIAGQVWWAMINRVLSRRTALGRRIAPRATAHGAPLIRKSPAALREGGVARVGRVDGIVEGLPSAAGLAIDADAVVWCTGFRGDFGWIDVPGLRMDARGYPIAPFGLVAAEPGLGFVGMPFQTKIASPLLGGVGSDAEHVVRELLRDRAAPLTRAATP